MKPVCQSLQDTLAAEGHVHLREDEAARAHVESCDDCLSFLERLVAIDGALAALPAHDASDELVERLLARPELAVPALGKEAKVERRLLPPWGWQLAAAAGVLAVLGSATWQWLTRGQDFQHVAQLRELERSNDEAASLDPDTQQELRELGDVEDNRPASGAELESKTESLEAGNERVGKRGEGEGVPGVVGGYAGRTGGLPTTPSPSFEEESARAPEPPVGQQKEQPLVSFYLPPPPEGLLDKKSKDDRYRFGNRVDRDELTALDNLSFLTPSGYWANTYLPGDPMIRFLDAQLRAFDRSRLEGSPRLHDAVRRVPQPFDPPERSALAVFLASDRSGVTEPTRLHLQVGLQAMERRAARRPAMNVAVVFDSTEPVPLEVEHIFSALARALEKAQEPGDRIRTVVAGENRDGMPSPNREAELAPNLEAALAQGISSVAGSEGADAVLGASLVVLVTGRPLGDATETLARLAHRSAVGGIPVSVFAAGAGTNPSEIERIALAGQGIRRLVAQPTDAATAVDDELASASRVVARAVRLRIRLAPGVQLVEVLGSEKLDTARAEAVREAEKAIDLRLAKNLGIDADRGEDEEGIQIVIPSFYAGDSHVVLLDVVASGPGPVADVTARFKDIGSLSNEVARTSLALERGDGGESSLETNVAKNVLADRLSESLASAAAALAGGDAAGAGELLRSFRDRLDAARVENLRLDDDDVRRDIVMLDEYLALIGTGATGDPAVREYVSASLRFASKLKVTSRLALD
ncbi:MAG TPA: hypothetical protein VLK65_14215 [Vicinamibacteria bacterium]|nr:hypothetical protein [Vicinamibacteria bacterium]